jgi:hypothetical protein
VQLKYVPELTFLEDPAIAQGERVEEILRRINAEAGPEPLPGSEPPGADAEGDR